MNLILAKVKLTVSFALACASSGIAAMLLKGGRTVHAAFEIPLDVAFKDSPTCTVPKRSSTATLLAECQLIVWDDTQVRF